MGFVLSSTGLHRMLTVAINTGDTNIKCLVIATGGTGTDAQIEDADMVTDFLGVAGEAEVTNGGYARPTLASVLVAKDETANWVQLSAAAPVINNVAAGSVWRRILYYWNLGADSACPILGIDTPAATLTPNGGNVTLPPLIVRYNDTSV